MTTEDERTYAIYRQITKILSLSGEARKHTIDNDDASYVENAARASFEFARLVVGDSAIGGVITAAAFTISRGLARHGYRIVEK